MVCRAAHHGLNEVSSRANAPTEVLGKGSDIWPDAIDVIKEAAFEQVQVRGEASLCRLHGDETVARGMANGEPARRALGVVVADAGRSEAQRQRQRMRGLRRVEARRAARPPPPRRTAPRNRSARCRGRARSDRRSPSQAGPSPRCLRRSPRCSASVPVSGRAAAMVSAAGMTMPPGVVRRRQMDVVDLTQPRQRAMEADVAGEAAACGRLRHQPAALGGVRAGDPGTGRVGHMQPHQLTRRRRERGRALLAQRMLPSSRSAVMRSEFLGPGGREIAEIGIGEQLFQRHRLCGSCPAGGCSAAQSPGSCGWRS